MYWGMSPWGELERIPAIAAPGEIYQIVRVELLAQMTREDPSPPLPILEDVLKSANLFGARVVRIILGLDQSMICHPGRFTGEEYEFWNEDELTIQVDQVNDSRFYRALLDAFSRCR